MPSRPPETASECDLRSLPALSLMRWKTHALPQNYSARSTGHPEFAFLPRKFKIAVSATKQDRAVIAFRDIGIELRQNEAGEAGYRILIGGGLGAPNWSGKLPLFLRLSFWDIWNPSCIYNRYGRRDNKYKARIKILFRKWDWQRPKRRLRRIITALKRYGLSRWRWSQR